MKDEKHRLRVIHCHGCGRGVLNQFSDECPLCGRRNSEFQLVHSVHYTCFGCGEIVALTIAALIELERQAVA